MRITQFLFTHRIYYKIALIVNWRWTHIINTFINIFTSDSFGDKPSTARHTRNRKWISRDFQMPIDAIRSDKRLSGECRLGREYWNSKQIHIIWWSFATTPKHSKQIYTPEARGDSTWFDDDGCAVEYSADWNRTLRALSKWVALSVLTKYSKSF